jgi:hypothetical protein
MVDIGGVLVGLVFVAAVAGLIAVNDLGSAESFQNTSNSENSKITQNSEDEIVRALNEMDNKLVAFFSDLKDDLGFFKSIKL